MVLEAVFLLVVLKIPVVYLCFVVWWAIRAEPRRDDGGDLVLAPVADTPAPDAPHAGSAWSRAPRSGRRDGRPRRPGGSRRPTTARAEASR
jgi:hypothetical protein